MTLFYDVIWLFRVSQLESALIYDAVQLFTTSVYNLSKEFYINETPTPCNSSLSWKHGFTLINYMKMAVSTREEAIRIVRVRVNKGGFID